MSRHRDRHHRHPEGETKRERRLQHIVGVGVVVVFLLLGTIVIQGIVGYRSQVNHHASTIGKDNALAKKDDVIIAQNKVIETQNDLIKSDTAALVAFHAQTVTILSQISALQKEFTSSVGQIPAVTAELKAGQQALLTELNDIDNRMDDLCAHLPTTVCPG